MKLNVPTNWDSGLIKELEKYPVESVYGKLNSDILGGGKASLILPDVGRKKIEGYVETLHAHGMQFIYLLNAPCFGNIEYDAKTYRKIISHMKWIKSIGADSVTVAVPFIAEIVKKQFPDLKVNVSVIAHVNSVQKARIWESLGVDEINLDFNINRDFELLRQIRKSVKCGLSLLLNDVCLYDCPFRLYHYNVVGHASQKSNPANRFYIEYCMANCTRIKLSRPEELLKSRWIRPEDIHHYEKMGFKKFKIAGRSQDTENILKMVQAYSSRKYEGNLIDILEGVFRKSSSKFSAVEELSQHEKAMDIIQHLFRILNHLPLKKRIFGIRRLTNFAARLPPSQIKNIIELHAQLVKLDKGIYIDNRKLEGFIDFFKRQKCGSGCGICNHCRKWSEKSVRMDKKEIDRTLEMLSRFLEDLNGGRFFSE